MNNNIDAEHIASALAGKRTANGWQCRCPAHDDKNPSLSLSLNSDGKILYRCHAGCTQDAVTEAFRMKGLLGTKISSGADRRTEYVYNNLNNQPALKVVRIDKSTGGKTFQQSHLEGDQWRSGGFKGEVCPYNFDAWRNEFSRWIVLVEGEKAADALTKHGFIATTTPGGSKNWKPCFAKHFAGRKVVCLPDEDEPGLQYMAAAHRDLKDVVATLKIVELPGLAKKGDVFDWFAQGNSADKLKNIIVETTKLSQRFTEILSGATSLNIGHSESNSANIAFSNDLPLPLRRDRPEPEKFPMDALGSVLGPAANRLHEVIKAPDGIVAQSILGGAALAVQAHCDVHLDGRVHPSSLFLISIADSGERKSAADFEALKPHREYERELKNKFDIDRIEFEAEKIAFESARAEKLKKAKGRDEKRIALAELGSSPVPPLYPILLCEEPTSQGLWKLLAEGQPSIGIFSDEGGRLFGGHGMSEENQLNMCAALSEFWDGKRTTRVRSGDGSSLLFGKRVSMHMMMQGIVAQSILANEIFNQQGFLARTLIAWPEPMCGQRPYDAIDLTTDESLLKYQNRISELLRMPLPLTEGKRNELAPRLISPSQDSKKLWVKFYDSIEKQLGEGKPLSSIKALASKVPQHVLRLSAVLAVVEDPETNIIGLDEMAAGIELMQYYIGEALRLHNCGSLDKDLLLAEKLLSWIKPFDYIYLSKIYQLGPSSIRDSKTAKKAVKILEEHRWLERVNHSMELDGTIRREVWRVKS